MADMKKIVEKISNLLDLAGNNPNENEALAAALKAQELMAKYHIELAEVTRNRGEQEEIVTERCHADKMSGMSKWKRTLAHIIAENFCCKTYLVGMKDVAFYGYQQDAQIAKQVFMFLFETGNRLARRQYNKAKKEGRYTKYVQNTYLMGFCAGIKEVLGKQCTALMVVVPQEVNDAYAVMAQNFRTIHNRIRADNSGSDYEQGVRDGKDTVSAKMLEGKSATA